MSVLLSDGEGPGNTSLEAQGVAVEEVHVDQERESQLAEEEHAGDKAPDLEITKNTYAG